MRWQDASVTKNASGAGLTYLIGPTAGYIYGMFIAATVIGFLSEKGFAKSYLTILISLLIGSVIIFSFGVTYLGLIIGFDKSINFGLLPFIPSELFKIALAVAIIPSLFKFVK